MKVTETLSEKDKNWKNFNLWEKKKNQRSNSTLDAIQKAKLKKIILGFYKSISHGFKDPILTIHTKTGCKWIYNLFIFQNCSMDMYRTDFKVVLNFIKKSIYNWWWKSYYNL